MVVRTLEGMSNEESSKLLFVKMNMKAEDMSIQKPQLPRKRKTHQRYDNGLAEEFFHTNSEEKARV